MFDQDWLDSGSCGVDTFVSMTQTGKDSVPCVHVSVMMCFDVRAGRVSRFETVAMSRRNLDSNVWLASDRFGLVGRDLVFV